MWQHDALIPLHRDNVVLNMYLLRRTALRLRFCVTLYILCLSIFLVPILWSIVHSHELPGWSFNFYFSPLVFFICIIFLLLFVIFQIGYFLVVGGRAGNLWAIFFYLNVTSLFICITNLKADRKPHSNNWKYSSVYHKNTIIITNIQIKFVQKVLDWSKCKRL